MDLFRATTPAPHNEWLSPVLPDGVLVTIETSSRVRAARARGLTRGDSYETYKYSYPPPPLKCCYVRWIVDVHPIFLPYVSLEWKTVIRFDFPFNGIPDMWRGSKAERKVGHHYITSTPCVKVKFLTQGSQQYVSAFLLLPRLLAILDVDVHAG